MTRASRFRLLATIGIVWLLASTHVAGAGGNPHRPPGMDIAAIAAKLDGMAVDVNFTPTPNSSTTINVPAPSTRSTSAEIAANPALGFGWIGGQFSYGLSTYPLPEFPQPRPGDVAYWDCYHSSIGYVAFIRKLGTSEWVHMGSGEFFGEWNDTTKKCNMPSPGSSFFTGTAYAIGGEPWAPVGYDYRIGVRKWQHNDTDFGHSGGYCAEDSCYSAANVHIKRFNCADGRWTGDVCDKRPSAPPAGTRAR